MNKENYFGIYIFLNVKQSLHSPAQSWSGPEGYRRFRLPYFIKIGT